MKKMVCFLLALAVSTISVSASAKEVPNSVSELAYMNIDSVSEPMQEKILQAREEVIYSKSWVADGYEGTITNPETGEVIETVPEFHDIFPEDWEIPIDESVINTRQEQKTEGQVGISPRASNLVSYDQWTYLRMATDVPASPFHTFRLDEFYDEASTRAVQGPMSRVNIAYINADTGAARGYTTDLQVGLGFNVRMKSGRLSEYISVKASTYDQPGSARMVVEKLPSF